MAPPSLGPRTATGLVFLSSFCVLVLEILAGRLLAPVVGVSLETFTGIIGTVLAGIATGSAVGGRLADRGRPDRLIGPALVVGGALSWVAPPLTTLFGQPASSDPATIVLIAAATFFAPAAVLSTVTPMVTKLRLGDVEHTGRVVGNLSAAGTAGSLAGTFLTGFVLVAALPTRTLIFAVGVVLVVAGIAFAGWRQLEGGWGMAATLLLPGVLCLALRGPCDAETAYACIDVRADPERASGLDLYLNGERNSYVDLDDPTYLEFRYMRLFADVVDVLAVEDPHAVHLGGAGFTFPRYLNAVRPDATGIVLEIDDELVAYAQSELRLELSPRLDVIAGDARLGMAALADDQADLVVGDAFAGLTVPWHLTTRQFVAEVDRVLTPDGVVMANLIDGGPLRFARSEAATYAERFEHVSLIVPPDDGAPEGAARNLILIASHEPVPAPLVAPADGRLLDEADTASLIDGAAVLDDDFAPVDQLRRSG